MGLNDNLAPLGIKGTPAEIFRLPIFANTIFSQSSKLWGLLAPFSVMGVVSPLYEGGVISHLLGLGFVSLFGGLWLALAPFCSGYAFFTIKNACLLTNNYQVE